jgi:hypothetical protein
MVTEERYRRAVAADMPMSDGASAMLYQQFRGKPDREMREAKIRAGLLAMERGARVISGTLMGTALKAIKDEQLVAR